MKITRLHHAYDFPGFKALANIHEYQEDSSTVVVTLKRTREKKDQNVPSAVSAGLTGMTESGNWSGISTADPCGSILSLKPGAFSARRAVW